MNRGTLCDTGPLVALVNRNDDAHEVCESVLPRLSAPWITTWPCITEAIYLLSEGGIKAQNELWDYITDGLLHIHDPDLSETLRMCTLMEKYHDTPMDLADASIVAAAEALGLARVFTIDKRFRAYRLHGRTAFDVIP